MTERLSPARLTLASHPGMLPDAFLLRFDPAHGEATDFVDCGVACPPQIARSVLKRRAEYLAGRRVARAALAEVGAPAGDLGSLPSRAPAWPAGFTGSITHASRFAAAVAMPRAAIRGVGIDIEDIVRADAIDAIEHTVIDRGEWENLAGLARRLDRATALTLAFSAKESFYKATSGTVGRVFDFAALRILDVRWDDSAIDVEVAEDLAPLLMRGTRFALGFSLLDHGSIVTTCRW